MALFGGESKEEKQAKKAEALLEKYGLQNLSDPQDLVSVKKITNELAGSGFGEAGLKLSMGTKTEDLLKVSYLGAIVEQNWIIIRQLDKLNSGK